MEPFCLWGFAQAVTTLQITVGENTDIFTNCECNNDHRRIRAYLAGFPGSAHDNRVWKHMAQYRNPEEYFDEMQYILCDTAYEPSTFCIPAYKCQTGYVQPSDQEYFNSCLATPRVITEHTMGLWKGRFPWLRNIRMLITNDPVTQPYIEIY